MKYVEFNDNLLAHVKDYQYVENEDSYAQDILEEFNERFNFGKIKIDPSVGFEKKLLDICLYKV